MSPVASPILRKFSFSFVLDLVLLLDRNQRRVVLNKFKKSLLTIMFGTWTFHGSFMDLSWIFVEHTRNFCRFRTFHKRSIHTSKRSRKHPKNILSASSSFFLLIISFTSSIFASNSDIFLTTSTSLASCRFNKRSCTFSKSFKYFFKSNIVSGNFAVDGAGGIDFFA